MRSITFLPNTLTPTTVTAREGTKKRVGQPRVKWVETGMDALWKLIGKTTRPEVRYTTMNFEK